ncbi:hypothetical protein N9R79_06180 [Vibrio sp.]|nr:hypothetical protein [Vibrio sp.]
MNTNQKFSLALLIFLLAGSALSNAILVSGEVVEQVISAISTVLSYAMVVCLFVKFKGSDIIGKKVMHILAGVFVAFTFIEGLAPVLIYSEQSFPSSFFTLFSIQLVINLFIARVITK